MRESSVFDTWSRWVAGPKTRWVTLIVWIVFAVVISVIAPSANKEETNNAASLPASSASVQAEAKMKQAFPNNDGTPALLVWFRKGGLTQGDLVKIQTVSKYLADHPVVDQQSVTPIYEMPTAALASLLSKDKTTLVLPVSFQNNAADTTLQTSLTQMQSNVTKSLNFNPFQDSSIATPGLHARVTGPVGIAVDTLGLFKNADFVLLASTTLLVLVLLILLYRSPVLAFVPLISVGFAYSVVSPLLGALAKSGAVVIDAQGVSIMTVLLFGAGTDYCLFLVARYRERLYHVRDKHQALREALGGAAGAISMSGLTVVLSLLALLFARYGTEQRFAVPFSLGILVMALAAITLVPALLAVFGRSSFFPFIPRTQEMWQERKEHGKRVPERLKTGEPGRVSQWIGRVVSHRPWTVAITGIVALVVLASLTFQMKTTYNILGSFPKDMPSRQGFTILSDHFSPGSLAPVNVLVEDGKPANQIVTDLQKLDFVKSVTAPKASDKVDNAQLISVTLNADPYSNAAMSDIPKIRAVAVRDLSSAGVASANQHVWISGETATQYDTKQLTVRDTKVVIPIVIGIIALLLVLYLRSIVAMVYLIGTVLLSYFSALGTGWLVLHYLMGASAIQGTIPLYAFVFLVALGEDYNIFMVSRIWQARHKLPLKEAISEGVSRTSSVITSAGLILAGTFAVLGSLPIQVLVQFGIVTAIGVLLDTFVVRPFVVPAITAIFGKLAFWPGKA